MASEIIQSQDSTPIINPGRISSASRGSENIAKTLGAIADRSIVKAADYAGEASKANLVQSHSMLQDIEAQSKIDIARSPQNAEAIARNSALTADKIKSQAKLNRGDRLALDSMAQSTVRGLELTAAEKSISLSREQAKYNVLSSLGDTLQAVRRDIHVNPENADALIQAQYDTLAGSVRTGVITAVEAANIHKQFTKELELAHELVQGIKNGTLSASDINTYHATDTGQIPLSNAHLPIDHVTAMNGDHYYGQLTLKDIESRFANGERVSPRDLTSIKNVPDLDKVLNYGAGAARATGDINAGTSWIKLKDNLSRLKKKEKKSSQEEGYQNRLNNFFLNAEKPGAYQDYIAGMPEGARAWQDYTQTEAAINSDVTYGTPEQVAQAKSQRHVDNLNNLISKSASIGIGMHYPDHLRQPIPLQMLQPIVNSFEKDGDIASAIANIQTLSPENRVYAMNAFPDNPRKQLTVLEVGNLAGKAEAGFLVDLMQSQQVDALGERANRKDAQEKFLQLDSSKEGFSDKKLTARIMPELTQITNYLTRQPGGAGIVSGKADQALRYIKKVAADHNDYKFEHINDYIKTYKTNMEAAYGIETGFNFVMSSSDVPIDASEKQLVAAHAIHEVRQKLLEYKTPAQVDEIFSVTPPVLVSSPGGRITVLMPNNQAIPDKYGHPAFSEIYTNSLLNNAKHDVEINKEDYFVINPLFGQSRIIRKD